MVKPLTAKHAKKGREGRKKKYLCKLCEVFAPFAVKSFPYAAAMNSSARPM
jgi:hypothetical protein